MSVVDSSEPFSFSFSYSNPLISELLVPDVDLDESVLLSSFFFKPKNAAASVTFARAGFVFTSAPSSSSRPLTFSDSSPEEVVFDYAAFFFMENLTIFSSTSDPSLENLRPELR